MQRSHYGVKLNDALTIKFNDHFPGHVGSILKFCPGYPEELVCEPLIRRATVRVAGLLCGS